MLGTQALLERQQELDLLRNLLADVGSSGGKVVLVRGEAGIGKSRLVREFLSASSDEAHGLVGWCDDLVTPQPLGPFWDVARAETSLAGPLADADRRGLFDAVMDLLSRRLRRTIIVLEDTHWADEATLDAIKYLGRRIEQTNGLLIVTYRDGVVDSDHPLRAVIGGLPPASVVRIQLGGLSPLAVALMLVGSDLDVSEVNSATDGNPFLVTELASVGGRTVPLSVKDSVITRMRTFSPEAQELLRILSVIPEQVSRREVSELTGESDVGLVESERRGMLEIGGEFVAFRHDLIRRAVESSLTTSEREALNRAVLTGLPADTDPARLVHHAREANDTHRLVELVPTAAAAAIAVGSHREARDHFRQLDGHIDSIASDLRGPILDRWSHEERIQLDYPEAIRVNELAVLHYRDTGDKTGESAALSTAALLHQRHGQRSTAERMARLAVDVLGPNPSGTDLAKTLEVRAYLAMAASDYPATLELVEQTLSAAGSDIDEYVLIRSLNHRACVLNHTRYPEGADSYDEAVRRAEAAGDTIEQLRAHCNRAESALEALDLRTAWEYSQRAAAVPVVNEWSVNPYIAAIRANILERRGQWNKAVELAKDDLDVFYLAALKATPVYAVIEARRGRPTARASVVQAWEMAIAAGEYVHIAPAAAVLAEYAWISGDEGLPISDIKTTMKSGLDAGTWSSALVAFWLWKLGELDQAPEGIAEPYLLTIGGDHMSAAVLLAEIGCPYERAIALSHGDESAQLEALTELDRLGADAVAAKLRQELRERGVSVPRRRSRKASDHSSNLTPRQAEVLSLLAAHQSNADIADQLFLSPRTVEHHVAAVMSKLDASSRDEAVEKAIGQGILVSPVR